MQFKAARVLRRWLSLLKEKDALDCLVSWMGMAVMPIVAWSSGKDSMVLLHLARQIRPDVGVLFFCENYQPHKAAFADSVIQEWGLDVYTYGPARMDINAGSGMVELIRVQDAGQGEYIYLPVGINPDFGSDYQCSLNLLVSGPGQTFDYPWDVTFVGHRSEDVDPVYGHIPLAAESAKVGNTTMVYPLRDWTTDEIWTYTERHNVPVNFGRYDKSDSYREYADKRTNNDYYDICTRCLSPYEESVVICPKVNQMVPNLSAQIDWQGRKNQWQIVNIQK